MILELVNEMPAYKKNQINSQIIFYVNEKTATQQEKKYSAPVT